MAVYKGYDAINIYLIYLCLFISVGSPSDQYVYCCLLLSLFLHNTAV